LKLLQFLTVCCVCSAFSSALSVLGKIWRGDACTR
jgi:hypothetical protein